jgi:hypothetical protein
VAGVCRGPDGRSYALACNTMEQDVSATVSPGSLLLHRPPESPWQVLEQLPELSLRSLCCLPDGRLFAVGMAGACVEYDPRSRALVRHRTPVRGALWRVFGTRRDRVFAAGEGALLQFDGNAWRRIDLAGALGPDATPTFVDVHAAGEEVVAVGAHLTHSCLLWSDGAEVQVRLEGVGAHSLYACVALGGGDALALANDGAWRRSGGAWRRAVDLSSRDVRPFGRPGCVGLHRGRVVLASVDGMDVLKAVLTDRGSLEGRRVHLWTDGEHVTIDLDARLGASFLGLDGGRLVVGLPGRVWDAPLPD